MDLGARTEILLCVRKEIVGACANNIGTADLWIVNGELSVSGGGPSAHELLCEGMG